MLDYREDIYQQYHKVLARKWLGERVAQDIEAQFVQTARQIGYDYERQVRKHVVSVLLAVMAAAGERNLEELRRADFEACDQHMGRSPRVASSGVTMAHRILAAMGYLAEETPRSVGGASRVRSDW